MVIDKNTLIADQALKIAQLEYSLERKTTALHNIEGVFYAIGGPFNDDQLGYTNEQLRPFIAIREYLNAAK